MYNNSTEQKWTEVNKTHLQWKAVCGERGLSILGVWKGGEVQLNVHHIIKTQLLTRRTEAKQHKHDQRLTDNVHNMFFMGLK